MAFKLTLHGVDELEAKLIAMNSIRFDAVALKSMTQMLNRARASGGTPVDTGELRKSSSADSESMGYTKEYAPYVEYGHRTVNGGYVPGQYFLKRNVATQQPIYRNDLLKAIKKELG